MDLTEAMLNFIDGFRTANLTQNEGDYTGDDGFLHCGVCGEPKECDFCIGSITRRSYRACKCDRERAEEEKRRREREEAAKQVKKLRNASLMDARFFEARFENCIETEANRQNLRICKRYVERWDAMKDARQGLLFWGTIGTGKSFAAACIANALMDRGVPVAMTSFVKLLDIMNEEYADDVMQRLMKCQLVIFDDLGAERETPYAFEKVFNIVDTRERSNLPMIVTTNLTIDQLANEPDERRARVYDRILGSCYPMQWTGSSWRKTEGRDRFRNFKKLIEGDKK